MPAQSLLFKFYSMLLFIKHVKLCTFLDCLYAGLTEKFRVQSYAQLRVSQTANLLSQFSLASFLNLIFIFVLKFFYFVVSCKNPFCQMERVDQTQTPNIPCPMLWDESG